MFINNLNELKENMLTIDKYLLGTEVELQFAKSLIKKGMVFVYNCGRFYPSRFIGYQGNNMDAHKVDKRDGKKTNVVISEILDSEPIISEYLDELYKKYCFELGVTPNNHKHTYWTLSSFYIDQVGDSNEVASIENDANYDELVINKDVANHVLAQIKNLKKIMRKAIFIKVKN